MPKKKKFRLPLYQSDSLAFFFSSFPEASENPVLEDRMKCTLAVVGNLKAPGIHSESSCPTLVIEMKKDELEASWYTRPV